MKKKQFISRQRNAQRNISDLRTRAQFDVASFNEESRSVDIVFATETPVLTRNWRILDGDPFNEVLSMTDGHIRMDRANNGLPVLKDHYNSVDNQVGIATDIRISGKEARAKVTFSRNEDGTKLMNDVKDGIVRNISCGYRVYSYSEVKVDGAATQTLRATDWEPMEISFVSVPADYNSNVRADGAEEYPVDIKRNSNINNSVMKREQIIAFLNKRGVQFEATATDEQLAELMQRTLDEIPAPTPAPTPTPTPTPAPAVDAKERSTQITNAVRAAKLDTEFALELINSDKTVDQARAAIIEKLAANEPKPQGTHSAAVGEERERKLEILGAEAALVQRADNALANEKNYDKETLKKASEFRGYRLLDFAKDALTRAGINVRGLDPMEIVARAFTSSTSDFPVLLEGTNRRILLANYAAAADTWRRFCSTSSVGDFREYKRLRMGTFGDLESLGENEEYRTKKITDADYEKVSIATKGNIINISRKMIVNDDLSAFTRLSMMLGRAAARSIENDVYAYLASNPTLVDGKELFHADHNNIATTAGAPTMLIVDEMRQTMAKHQDKDANDYLDIRPELVLAPLSLGSTLRTLNDALYDPDVTGKYQKPNVVKGMFNDVIDTPRLDGTAWYMFANPNMEPVFEVNFLNGVQEPFMDSERGFDVDGIRWKIRHDYGVGVVGYRGVIKNAGA